MRFTILPDLGFTLTRRSLPGDDHLCPDRRITMIIVPSDDQRGNSTAPDVPGTRSRRDEPSVASTQSALGIVLFSDSVWLKLSVAASHRPSGEQAGHIQLLVK